MAALSVPGCVSQEAECPTLGFSWPLIVALLSALPLFGLSKTLLLSDPDTYWHLAAGKWMLSQWQVPSTDPFSHSMPGAPWLVHEWLAEVTMAAAYNVAGWAGPVALAVAAFSATLAYLMRFLLARLEPLHAIAFTLLAGFMMWPHLLARPHVLVWPLLAIWLGTLVDANEKRRAPPYWLVPVMLLWANLHGSFTLGLALASALALEAVLSAPASERFALARRWASFLALSVLASMATPNGWEGLWFTLHVINMQVALAVIGEWQSPNFHKLQPLELWLMLMLGLALAGKMRLPWLRLILVLGLVHLSLKHQRYVSILGLVSTFLIAAPMARAWCQQRTASGQAQTLDRFFAALAMPAKPLAICASALMAASVLALAAPRFAPAADRTPEAAVRAAMAAGAKGRVLNDYNFGGYLVFQQIPVFIDGRADMYGDAFLKKLLEATSLKDRSALPQLLEQYRIGWTLQSPDVPAVALLDGLPGWRRVYADAVAVVHVRNE